MVGGLPAVDKCRPGGTWLHRRRADFPPKNNFFKYAPVANILLLCWPSFSVSVEKILRFWFKLCWKAALLPMMYGAGGRLTAAQLHSLPLQRNDRLSRELHKNCTSPPLSNPMQVGFTALRHSTSSTQVHSAVPSLLLYFRIFSEVLHCL